VPGVSNAEIRSHRDVADVKQAAGGALAFEGKDHAMADIRDAPQRRSGPAETKAARSQALQGRCRVHPDGYTG
jgi:hypothetical protein